MIRVQKLNVQLQIDNKDLSKYIADGYDILVPKKSDNIEVIVDNVTKNEEKCNKKAK